MAIPLLQPILEPDSRFKLLKEGEKDRLSFQLGADASGVSVAIKRLSDEQTQKSASDVRKEMSCWQKLRWVPMQLKGSDGADGITVLVNRFSWAKRCGGSCWTVAQRVHFTYGFLTKRLEKGQLTYSQKIFLAQEVLRLKGLPVPDQDDLIWQDHFIVDSLAYHALHIEELEGDSFHGIGPSSYSRYTRGISFHRGRLYIHKNKIRWGDHLAGQGSENQVKVAICLERGADGSLQKRQVVRLTSKEKLKGEERSTYSELVTESVSRAVFSQELRSIFAQILQEKAPYIAGVEIYTQYRGKRRKKILQVQEYFSLGSLRACLKKRRVEPQDQKKLVLSLLEGLAWLHEKEILHGDIKPQNILLKREQNGYLGGYIADLGGARRLQEGIDDRGDISTPYYEPPESRGANKDRYWGRKLARDVWAMGVVILDILEGKSSRREKSSIGDVARKQRKRFYKDHFLKPLLDRMLAKTAEERISARDALALACELCEQ